MSHDFPVIDIAAVRQPQVSAAARFEIARQVASACEEIGFFAVTGHGVPGAVIADLVAQSYAFFDLPLAEKLAVRRPRPEQNRGYIAPGEERLARLRGDERRVGRKSKRTHLQDFVHGDGPLRSIGQQTTPIAVRVPLCSVPDEGLGREHVRRAYSPQLNLPRQGASIHRCPERDKSVPRTPDPQWLSPS